ncbi:hypothetical protein ACFUEN_28755 [Streptomyces griseorubiginosus]|uniref:hypothetical protein n=1 Tax=Streptomyces griseorubiginosus TaxID=67304 RepID=UPI00362FDB32
MDTSPWASTLAIVIPALASVAAAWVARARPDDEEDVAEMPAAPPQPSGTWQVSPEMYRWFEEQMKGLHTRVRAVEDDLRTAESKLVEAQSRGDRTDRLLSLALVHIGHQDERLLAAGIPLVPMDPELIAARDSR